MRTGAIEDQGRIVHHIAATDRAGSAAVSDLQCALADCCTTRPRVVTREKERSCPRLNKRSAAGGSVTTDNSVDRKRLGGLNHIDGAAHITNLHVSIGGIGCVGSDHPQGRGIRIRSDLEDVLKYAAAEAAVCCRV